MAAPGVYRFEGIDDALAYIPLAGRRVLDALGRKLSLEAWQSLSASDRARIVAAGTGDAVDDTVLPVIDGAVRPPARLMPEPEPDPSEVPAALAAALGSSRPLAATRWSAMSALDRYALVKCMAKADKLARAYDELVAGKAVAPREASSFTHLNERGAATMVGVSSRAETVRRAVATACVRTTGAVVAAIAEGSAAKGDVLAAARIAGILASKQTANLIPLCHPVRTTSAAVDFELDEKAGEIRIRSAVEAVDRTGVEMEAMVAVAVAGLTLYDMTKSMDRWASLDAVRLEAKEGGKSGPVRRPTDRS